MTDAERAEQILSGDVHLVMHPDDSEEDFVATARCGLTRTWCGDDRPLDRGDPTSLWSSVDDYPKGWGFPLCRACWGDG